MTEIGDRVTVLFDNEPFAGEVLALTSRRARVKFDDGDIRMIALDELTPEVAIDDEPEESGETEHDGRGFNLYAVEWNETNFGVTMDDGSRFYGCWRKTVFGDRPDTRREGYAIDIWAKYKGHEYAVDSIPYLDIDPRSKPKSLDADICAAISKFMFYVENDSDNLEQLRKKASRPRVRITRLSTLDQLCMRILEMREVALRSGGERIFTIEGDREEDPILGIIIDVTAQAALIKDGRIPPLDRGAILDTPAGRGGDGRAFTFRADPKSIAALVEKLRVTKNKAEARKLRAVLRKMGHRGGARSIQPSGESHDQQD